MHHKIIRNSDGSAYVVDHKGKHVATHDSAEEAKEHLEQLREKKDEHEIKSVKKELSAHIKHDASESHKMAEELRMKHSGSHDPYYEHSKKNN